MHDYYNLRYYGENGIIKLTPIENEILDLLLNPKKQVVTFKKIINKVYKNQTDYFLKRCIRTHITHLNSKLKGELRIYNVKDLGYLIY